MSKKIVISGSIKFHSLIEGVIKELTRLGFAPLFPNLNYSLENKGKEMTIKECNRLACEHYEKIKESDAAYFILPKGYMGTSCKLELGYALALEKPIYFSELTNDMALDGYVKKIIPLDKLSQFKEEF
jgi:nucleoside 2-deoxyribosyltransferase